MTITMTRPTAAPTATRPADTDGGCYVTVNPNHRLSIMDAANGSATGVALAGRTIGGAVHRVALRAGVTVWLDGDDQDGSGELNWAATQMCAALSGGVFTGPHGLPFVCGPALFTATATGDTVGLSERQVALLVEAHAAVEHPDTDLADAADWDR
ncbi:hypothetical protein [Dactylosporangium sp. CA-092794]|uniref:hypothetical protein n=1 Tax=Dactylosporangium sp. CA-092794 TaxID=3239929 RepID=UPI003D92A0B0